MAEDPLNPNHLFGHVQDATQFDVPRGISPDGRGHIYLPQPLAKPMLTADGKPATDEHGHPQYQPLWTAHTGVTLIDDNVQPINLTLTKFMVLEVVVALVMCLVFGGLALRMRGGR